MRCARVAFVAIAFVIPVNAYAQTATRVCATQITLLDQFIEAPIVVVGRLQNAVAPNNALPNGRTELVIDQIVVEDPSFKELKQKKVLMMDQELSASNTQRVFAIEFYKGQLVPYMSVETDKQGELIKFIKGAIELKDKSRASRMRYSVDFLMSPNEEVAEAAIFEMDRGTYADFRRIAEKLDPNPLFKAFQNASPRRAQLGTYAKLLGHCGTSEHAIALRKSLDAEGLQKRIPDLMLGYVLLDQRNGWPYVTSIAWNGKQPFLVRYAALYVMRTIAAERTDVIDAKRAFAGIAGVLRVSDMADFAIEDLRRHRRWEYCEAVLELHGKKGYTSSIISKAILRYALQCPLPLAKAHVLIESNRDPENVAYMKERLDLEK